MNKLQKTIAKATKDSKCLHDESYFQQNVYKSEEIKLSFVRHHLGAPQFMQQKPDAFFVVEAMLL